MQVTRKFDFAGKNAGKFLIDAGLNKRGEQSVDFPLYSIGRTTTTDENGLTISSAVDGPRLPVGGGATYASVLPERGGTTSIDITYEFVTYAVGHFKRDANYCIYYLAATDAWNVRFAGTITAPAGGGYKFTPTPGVNGITDTNVFTIDNSDSPEATSHPVIKPVTANTGGQKWR